MAGNRVDEYFAPYRLRTVRIGVESTVLILVVLAALPYLPGHGAMDRTWYAVVLVVAALGALGIGWAIPWRKVVGGRAELPLLYAWSIADIELVCVAIFATGGASSDLYIVFALTTVFYAASYPRRGQVALMLVTICSYTATLALCGWGIGTGLLVVRLAGISVVGFMGSFLAGELGREMVDHAEARAESEERADQLLEAAAARAAMEERVTAIMQNSTDIIWVLSADGTIRYASPAVERVLGTGEGFAIGDSAITRVHPDDVTRVLAAFERAVGRPGVSDPVEFRMQRIDGTWRVIEALANNLLDQPAIDGLVVNARDVTERREMEARLAHQALHDTLTGLPNRSLLRDRLGHALDRVRRNGGSVVVMFLDLDNFKLVNDTLGHAAGDRLLVTVGERIGKRLRSGDTLARIGGDEFVLLCEDVSGPDDANLVAGRVQDAMRRPVVVDGQEVYVSVSVGVAVGVGGVDPDALLSHADAAMYAAKKRGRNRTEIYDDGMRDAALDRLETETSLRRALERNEFELWFQPKVVLSTGRIMGAEALIRWQHPARGLVMPNDFIPVAEESGLIVPIGEWVLRTACAEAVRWPVSDGSDGVAPVVSVNLSARQLAEPDLLRVVTSTLADTGLSPDRLLLEITETTLMEDAGASVDVLQALRELGVRIAIDDFGTGYSSLSYLRQFPVDYLKVDRSFVAHLDADGETGAIVEAIIAMAHSLGLAAIAEGVEQHEQAANLLALGCDMAQGYWFGRPTEVAQLRRLLAEQREGQGQGQADADRTVAATFPHLASDDRSRIHAIPAK